MCILTALTPPWQNWCALAHTTLPSEVALQARRVLGGPTPPKGLGHPPTEPKLKTNARTNVISMNNCAVCTMFALHGTRKYTALWSLQLYCITEFIRNNEIRNNQVRTKTLNVTHIGFESACDVVKESTIDHMTDPGHTTISRSMSITKCPPHQEQLNSSDCQLKGQRWKEPELVHLC